MYKFEFIQKIFKFGKKYLLTSFFNLFIIVLLVVLRMIKLIKKKIMCLNLNFFVSMVLYLF